MSRLKRFVLFFYCAIFGAGLLFPIIPVPASAVSDTTNGMAVPPALVKKPGSGNQLNWGASDLKIEFFDRAVMKVTLTQSGETRVFPSGTNTTKLKDVIADIYVRNEANDRDYNYKNSDQASHINIDADAWSKTRDGDLSKRWAKVSEADIRAAFTNGFMMVSTLSNNANKGGPYPLGTNACAGEDKDQYAGFLNTSDDRGDGYTHDVSWACKDGHTDFDQIKGIETNLSGDINNANITHKANSDASRLEVVFPSDDENKDAFIYCPDVQQYALEDCKDPRDGYFIEQNQGNMGGNATVTVRVKSSKSKPEFDMVVAQSGMQNSGIGSGGGSGGGGSTDPNANPSFSCENKLGLGDIATGKFIGKGLNWMICTIVRAVNGAIKEFDKIIRQQLEFGSDKLEAKNSNCSGGTCQDQGYYQAWSAVRYIAVGLLVLIGLVMVISQLVGVGIFDAYTVKKVLPRMLAAAILITLSWTLCKLAIEIINIIGGSVRQLLYAPFGGVDGITQTINNNLNSGNAGTQSGFFVGAAVGGYFLIGTTNFMVILTFALPALVAVVIGFFFIVLRKVIIILLVILSPLAIVAYILPGTEKIWKFWRENFFKALIAYPLIMAFLTMGKIFAAVIIQDGGGGFINQIIAIVAYFGPYFAIPATFKLAGGLLTTFTGALNDRSRGLLDRNRKFRQGQQKQTWANTKAGHRFKSGKEGSLRSRLNTGMQGVSMLNRAGLRPTRMRGNLRNAIADNRWEGGHEAAEKLPGAKAFFANDDAMLAALYGNGDYNKTVGYLNKEKGYSLDQARMVAGQGLRLRDQMGSQAFALTALSKLPGTGTAYKGEKGIESWLQDVDKYTGGNKSLAASIIASGKGGFRSAQQYEFSEAGFGDMMGALDMVAGRKLKADGTRYAAGEVGEHITNLAYKAVGASGIVNARNDDSARAFARAAHRDMQAAIDSGDAGAIGRAMAQIENIRDVSGQGKRTVTDAYIDELSQPGMTVKDASGNDVSIVDFTRAAKAANDPAMMGAYKQVKNDFSVEQQAQAAAAAAAAAMGGAGGTPPGTPPTPPVGGGPGVPPIPSDYRLKRSVVYLGKTPNGIKLYRFQYLWSDKIYVGVMAQDLVHSHPEALSVDSGGYYLVDYSVLGLEMMTYEQFIGKSTTLVGAKR